MKHRKAKKRMAKLFDTDATTSTAAIPSNNGILRKRWGRNCQSSCNSERCFMTQLAWECNSCIDHGTRNQGDDILLNTNASCYENTQLRCCFTLFFIPEGWGRKRFRLLRSKMGTQRIKGRVLWRSYAGHPNVCTRVLLPSRYKQSEDNGSRSYDLISKSMQEIDIDSAPLQNNLFSETTSPRKCSQKWEQQNYRYL